MQVTRHVFTVVAHLLQWGFFYAKTIVLLPTLDEIFGVLLGISAAPETMTTSKGAFPRCGVTYVGQLEHEYMWIHKLSVCAGCLSVGWDKPLKRCNGCQLADYCSKRYGCSALLESWCTI